MRPPCLSPCSRATFPALRESLLAALLATLAGTVTAQLPPPSGRPLSEARGGVIKGSASGVQLIGPRSSEPAAAASAPAMAGATDRAQAVDPPAAAQTAPAAPPQGARPGRVQPPRGEAMATGKRLDSPALGIALPLAGRPATAGTTPAAAPAKPASAATR